MTGEELTALLEEWQERLRIRDWNITIAFAPYHEVDGFAATSGNVNHHEARIRMVDVEEIPANILGCRDYEVTLVHELIHVVHMPIDELRKVESHPYEFATEQIAQALVNAKRGEEINQGEGMKHTKKHPGFHAEAEKIAKEHKISIAEADRILASASRGASKGAKKRNPRLKRVK